jgi:hypothetical protein
LRDREDWLLQLRDEVAPWYEAQGWELPSVRIGVGFPSTGRRSKRIGECWMAEASEDKHSEIFIHPGYADSVDVAGTVVHELIHAAVNADGKNKKHGPVFKKVALAIGLAGPMRATHVGEELAKKSLTTLSSVSGSIRTQNLTRKECPATVPSKKAVC